MNKQKKNCQFKEHFCVILMRFFSLLSENLGLDATINLTQLSALRKNLVFDNLLSLKVFNQQLRQTFLVYLLLVLYNQKIKTSALSLQSESFHFSSFFLGRFFFLNLVELLSRFFLNIYFPVLNHRIWFNFTHFMYAFNIMCFFYIFFFLELSHFNYKINSG